MQSQSFSGVSIHIHTYTHKQLCTGEICLMMIHIPIPTLDCLHKHIFLLCVCRSVSLVRMRRYTQLAYLFHQCATNLLRRDGHIADCTVRHPGVERPFSSSMCFTVPSCRRVVERLNMGPRTIFGWVEFHCVQYRL